VHPIQARDNPLPTKVTLPDEKVGIRILTFSRLACLPLREAGWFQPLNRYAWFPQTSQQAVL